MTAVGFYENITNLFTGAEKVPCLPIAETGFVVLDTELTGLDVKADSILSIGAVSMKGSSIELGNVFYKLVRPEAEISRESVVIHGITPSEVAGQEPIDKAIPELCDFCGTDVIVGFPGEGEEEFREPLDLLEEVGFDTVYSFAYSPRPGTSGPAWPPSSGGPCSRPSCTWRTARPWPTAWRRGSPSSGGRSDDSGVDDSDSNAPIRQISGSSRTCSLDHCSRSGDGDYQNPLFLGFFCRDVCRRRRRILPFWMAAYIQFNFASTAWAGGLGTAFFAAGMAAGRKAGRI